MILDESSISAGTRRLTAVTGDAAIEAIGQLAELDVMFAEARATSGPALATLQAKLRAELKVRVLPAAGKMRLVEEEKVITKRVLVEQKVCCPEWLFCARCTARAGGRARGTRSPRAPHSAPVVALLPSSPHSL